MRGLSWHTPNSCFTCCHRSSLSLSISTGMLPSTAGLVHAWLLVFHLVPAVVGCRFMCAALQSAGKRNFAGELNVGSPNLDLSFHALFPLILENLHFLLENEALGSLEHWQGHHFCSSGVVTVALRRCQAYEAGTASSNPPFP